MIAAEVSPGGALRIYIYASDEARQILAFVDYESIDTDPRDGEVFFVFADQSGLPRRIQDEYGRCVWRAARVDPYGSLEIDPESSIEYGPQ